MKTLRATIGGDAAEEEIDKRIGELALFAQNKGMHLVVGLADAGGVEEPSGEHWISRLYGPNIPCAAFLIKMLMLKLAEDMQKIDEEHVDDDDYESPAQDILQDLAFYAAGLAEDFDGFGL